MLRLHADERHGAVVSALIQKAGEAFGFPTSELDDLVSAADGVFNYVAQKDQANTVIELRCTDGSYYMAVEFRFNLAGFDLRFLNAAQEDWPIPESASHGLGLFTASRRVDRLSYNRTGPDGINLDLIKFRPYDASQLPDGDATAVRLLDIKTERASGEKIRIATRRMIERYGPELRSRRLNSPEMVRDMVGARDLFAIVAEDSIERLGGVLYWLWRSDRTVEFFGPYVFDVTNADKIGEALTVACLNELAKSEAVGLYGRYTTPQLPTGYFEDLGAITIHARQQENVRTAWFRLMKEDPGAVIWADASVADFLRKEYEQLALAREIRLVDGEKPRHPPHSVLTTEFDRGRGRAILRPIATGVDIAENILRHRDLLLKEEVPDLIAEIDLGVEWHADFLSGFAEAGFVPCVILPLCAEQDLLVLQYER